MKGKIIQRKPTKKAKTTEVKKYFIDKNQVLVEADAFCQICFTTKGHIKRQPGNSKNKVCNMT